MGLILVWLPYTLLVEVGVLFTTIPALLQVAIFLHLRRAKPNTQRPYKVGGAGRGESLCVCCRCRWWPALTVLARAHRPSSPAASLVLHGVV